VIEDGDARGGPVLPGVAAVGAEIEGRDDVAPLLVLGNVGEEHRSVVAVVTFELDARDVDGDDDVRVGVTARAMTQRDLVVGVGFCRAGGGGDAQGGDDRAEHDRHDTQQTSG